MRQILRGMVLLALAFRSASAALVSRASGQACSNTVTDVTWVADANDATEVE